MANMSYCRFENTLIDLRECQHVLDHQGITGLNEYDELLSSSEVRKAVELIEMCREITERFTDVDLDLELMVYKKAKSEEDELYT